MNKRTIDGMIAYFNQEVSKMDIAREYKMALLGMITAIGFESKKQEVVRCAECKYTDDDGCGAIYCQMWDRWEMPEDAYCYLGERMDGKEQS